MLQIFIHLVGEKKMMMMKMLAKNNNNGQQLADAVDGVARIASWP